MFKPQKAGRPQNFHEDDLTTVYDSTRCRSVICESETCCNDGRFVKVAPDEAVAAATAVALGTLRSRASSLPSLVLLSRRGDRIIIIIIVLQGNLCRVDDSVPGKKTASCVFPVLNVRDILTFAEGWWLSNSPWAPPQTLEFVVLGDVQCLLYCTAPRFLAGRMCNLLVRCLGIVGPGVVSHDRRDLALAKCDLIGPTPPLLSHSNPIRRLMLRSMI